MPLFHLAVCLFVIGKNSIKECYRFMELTRTNGIDGQDIITISLIEINSD